MVANYGKVDEIYTIAFATKSYSKFGESESKFYFKKREKTRLKHTRWVLPELVATRYRYTRYEAAFRGNVR